MAWCYTGVKRKGGLQRWKQRLNGRIDVYRMEKSSLATPLMWSGAVRRSQKGVSTATPIHWPLAMVTLSGVREPGGVLLAFLTGWLPFAGIERQRLKVTGVWSSVPQWLMCLRNLQDHINSTHEPAPEAHLALSSAVKWTFDSTR